MKMAERTTERIIVSGATSGVGRPIAVRLAARATTIGVMGRRIEAANDVAAEAVRRCLVTHLWQRPKTPESPKKPLRDLAPGAGVRHIVGPVFRRIPRVYQHRRPS
jgi:NAD(P)-dependent dehydrogenase (short-subunit alcohol dehydrogenase family)